MSEPVKAADGSGPGSHPGVTIVKLDGDQDQVAANIETALEGGRTFLFKYFDMGTEFAVFASEYKKN